MISILIGISLQFLIFSMLTKVFNPCMCEYELEMVVFFILGINVDVNGLVGEN